MNKNIGNPPRSAIRFLRWFCPPALYEGIEGDLLEKFARDREENGVVNAKRALTISVIRFFRPEIVLRNKISTQIVNTIMLGNYFKVAARNIGKRKFYSFINAFGLSIGIAFCTLIYLYIQDEKSFDQFHSNKNRIYLLMGNEFNNNAFKKGDKDPIRHSASMPAPFAEVVRDELQGIENVTRFARGSGLMHFQDKVFKESVSYVDSGFFKMFSFKMIAGSKNKLFSKSSDAVITQATAEKYFGRQDAVGKEFTFGNDSEKTFTVAAVVETPPAESSLAFTVLLPVESRPWYKESLKRWDMWSYPTFIEVTEQTNLPSFRPNFDKLVDKYMGEMFKRWQKDFEVPEGYQVVTYDLVKLTDLHHNVKLSWHKVSDPQYSYILGGIAILILLIACINYVSLALTTSIGRRIEVGIRKAVGAQKKQVVYQFSIESMVLAILSMVIGLGIMTLFLPAFNSFTGKSIELTLSNLPQVATAMLVTSLVAGILAGSYPALYLSAFKPAVVLKGRLSSLFTVGNYQTIGCFAIRSVCISHHQFVDHVSANEVYHNKGSWV